MKAFTIGLSTVVCLIALGCTDATDEASSTSGSVGAGAAGGGGAGGTGGASTCEGSQPDDPRVAAALDQLRELSAEKKLPGGAAVAIVQNGEILGLGVFGTKLEPGCDPMTEDTLFRVTKATELITTLAVLDAVEEERLSLDASIVDTVTTLHVENDTHGSVDQITLRHLLAETSGYRAVSDQWHTLNTCTTLVDSVANADIPLLYFPPGTMQQPGTWSSAEIAGLALQIVDGVPYPDAVRARVLDPLGMGGAFDDDELVALNHARGHYTTPTDSADPEICANRFPSDGYHGSIRDIAKLLAYLTGGPGTVLEPNMLDEMLSEQGPMFWSSEYMPFGFDEAWHQEDIGDDVLLIDSSRGGYYQLTIMLKQRRLAMTILWNADMLDATDYVNDLAPRLERMFADIDPTLAALRLNPPFMADPLLVASVAGRYTDTFGFNSEGERAIEVSVDPRDATRLHGVITSNDGATQSIDLTPFIAQDNFRVAGETWQNARFWRDDDGFSYAMSFGADGGPPFFREPE